MDKCRACLSTGCALNSMDEEFARYYNILTNLDVKISDDLSHFVCEICLRSVQFFIAFRDKCILSEALLFNINEGTKLTKESNEDGNIVKVEFENVHDETYQDCMDNVDTYEDPITYQYTEDINNLTVTNGTHELLAETKATVKKERRKVGSVGYKCMSKEEKNVYKRQSKIRSKTESKKSVIAYNDEPFACGICPNVFEVYEKLSEHLLVHKDKLTCLLCHKDMKHWGQLLAHRIVHLPVAQKRCHICFRRYIGLEYLENHYRKIHFQEKDIILHCSLCPNKYTSVGNLSKHMWDRHSDKIFICDTCGNVYNNKTRLVSHTKSHLANKSLSCDKCDFTCKYNSALKDHRVRRHAPRKVYCKNCTRPFETQEAFERHKCAPRQPAVCAVCGVTVNSAKSLKRHMDSHVAVGQFKCSRCPKRYKRLAGLRVHLQQHDGKPAHRCEYCDAAFYHAAVLVKHRRTHTGEKPYKCKICDKAFTGNNNLKVHMRVHGEYNLITKREKPENQEVVF